jgi:hypothetical protein
VSKSRSHSNFIGACSSIAFSVEFLNTAMAAINTAVVVVNMVVVGLNGFERLPTTKHHPHKTLLAVTLTLMSCARDSQKAFDLVSLPVTQINR